jgi:hypothetical protein
VLLLDELVELVERFVERFRPSVGFSSILVTSFVWGRL